MQNSQIRCGEKATVMLLASSNTSTCPESPYERSVESSALLSEYHFTTVICQQSLHPCRSHQSITAASPDPLPTKSNCCCLVRCGYSCVSNHQYMQTQVFLDQSCSGLCWLSNGVQTEFCFQWNKPLESNPNQQFRTYHGRNEDPKLCKFLILCPLCLLCVVNTEIHCLFSQGKEDLTLFLSARSLPW